MQTEQKPPEQNIDKQFFIDAFGISPDQFINNLGLQKADKNEKNIGVAGKVPPLRGFNEELYDMYSARGVKENFPPIPHPILREVERKNPIVSSIVNTRCKQMRPFSLPSRDEDTPGFTISLKDMEKKPTKLEKDEMRDIEQWFFNTGRTDYRDWQDREDMLLDVMIKYARDALTIDQIAIELRRDRSGKIVDFWILDGATIRRVMFGGYRGSKGDVDPRANMVIDDKTHRAILEAKLAMVPNDMTEVSHVQMLDKRIVAAYTREDIIFEALQKRSDIRFYGYGYSPIEQALSACTAFLHGLQYNAEAFNSGTLPKIALTFKEGNFSPEQMIALQDQWIANFRGAAGAWRIPMLNADTNVIDLYKSSRDMEYIKYLEFTGAIICAIMGIDSAEMGLRFQQAQNVLNENQGARQKFSKDRGLNDILGAFSTTMNKIMRLLGWSDKYVFRFTGIEPEDKSQTSKIRTEAVKRDKTVNEVRAEQDLKALEHGDVILDPTYIQYVQQKEMAAQEAEMAEAEEPGAEAEEMGEITDEAIDDMFKAIPENKVRTLLK
jgi:hypothetical protein